MNIAKPDGFQWEKSFTVLTSQAVRHWFGIDKPTNTWILAIPFIPDCFNKLTYLFKESNLSQIKRFDFYFPDNSITPIAIIPNALSQIYLPTKRFILTVRAKADEDTDYDIMLKFLKS